MHAIIYKPARNAMQSGEARSRQWVLVYQPKTPRAIDPLMGWTASDDTRSQVRLHFDTREQALAYARANGIDAVDHVPAERRLNIRPRGYGENFATERRGSWTH